MGLNAYAHSSAKDFLVGSYTKFIQKKKGSDKNIKGQAQEVAAPAHLSDQEAQQC